MDEWSYERDLKFDLLSAQCRGRWQFFNLGEGSRELLDGFNQRRAIERSLSGLPPLARGVRDKPSFGEMTS